MPKPRTWSRTTTGSKRPSKPPRSASPLPSDRRPTPRRISTIARLGGSPAFLFFAAEAALPPARSFDRRGFCFYVLESMPEVFFPNVGGMGDGLRDLVHIRIYKNVGDMDGVVSFLLGMMIAGEVAQYLERIGVVLPSVDLDVHPCTGYHKVD